MFQDHYPPLVISYLVALGGWLAFSRVARAWPREPLENFARPWKSRDVVWFWCVHFCLDMTQFPHVSGVE